MAKTLAAKLKLKSVSRVYQKFGTEIRYHIPGTDRIIEFARPKLPITLKNFKGTTNYTDNLKVVDWELRTVNFFNYVCASCGSSEGLQVHPVKHIKTIDAKLGSFDKQMAAINRKQITLCGNCHQSVHAGKYDGLSLRHMKTVRS